MPTKVEANSEMKGDMGLINKPGTAGPSWVILKAFLLLISGACGITAGCKGSQTIWSAEARSPDGKMIATARTVAQSGFGTGYIGTIVHLNWTKGSQPPQEILGLSGGTEAPGATSVEMEWLTPTHLELTYKSPRVVDFQAVKCDGVDISVRDLSNGPVRSSQ
jgi:hypothetical protein